MTRFTLVFMLAGSLMAADRLIFPIDPELMAQTSAALQTAVQDGDFAGVLTQGRRMMELYPNEPVLHASIYRLMSEAAQKGGDATQASQYAAVAKRLDPSLDARLSAGQSATATRGSKMENVAAAMQVVAQGVQVYQAVRTQALAQKQAQLQMQMQQQQMQNQMQQQVQQQQMQQQQLQQQWFQQQQMQQSAPQQGASVNFPQVPVGDPNYQQRQVAPAPMPGWGPPPQSPQQQAQGGGPYSPPLQAEQPQQQPQFAQPQAGGPYSPPLQAQQQPYPYPPGTAPYAGNGYVPSAGATRGEKAPLFKVIHDHSHVGDTGYFQESCGALLAVSGMNLTFTPSGGESAVVIPSSDILEIRMNTLVGRNNGEFHIGTRQGLYLSLVLASQDRDEARAAVDSVRAKLGLE